MKKYIIPTNLHSFAVLAGVTPVGYGEQTQALYRIEWKKFEKASKDIIYVRAKSDVAGIVWEMAKDFYEGCKERNTNPEFVAKYTAKGTERFVRNPSEEMLNDLNSLKSDKLIITREK